MKTHWDLFIGFFRVGMLGFGGGPASIPLIQKEVVNKYKWLNDDEFGDILAIGNSLPGPIATKLAGYIGYRVSGVFGMINAILANIIPTILLMIALLTSLSFIEEFNWVQGMTAGVIPVVGMMMATLTWQFINKSGKGFGWKKAIIIVVILIVLLQVIHIHPGIIIAILLVVALSIKNKENNSEKKEGKQTT
ncbi:chromate transporter [Ornithinibacillus salinisoli]|uniref:Chromate transporter n=1 Tax=Ornithinibacillus salinisoli TaxID=1848459 RepID=A0ABW4W025_9BACI